jgi:SAM-dependent methyltransferase
MMGINELLAYEEHRYFVYLRGSIPSGIRRLFFLKPATFVIYDLPVHKGRKSPCSEPPEMSDRRISVDEGDSIFIGKTSVPDTKDVSSGIDYTVESVWTQETEAREFVNILHVGKDTADASYALPTFSYDKSDSETELTVTAGDRVFSLVFPAAPEAPGTISILHPDRAEPLLARRPIAAGILPHGTDGVQMIERWDSAYRHARMPGWDVGHPAVELERTVQSGSIRPGTALVLGCGTGTNAVYLAEQGFDVTGVDLAPSALVLAEKRAEKANVSVRWLVADVTAIPDIGPFDFIFDRGCYHHVRRYEAEGYVGMMNELASLDTHILILAGNANEMRSYGPPRVTQTDIVNDFSRNWDIVLLKEIRFQSRNPNAKEGALAWSILLRFNPFEENRVSCLSRYDDTLASTACTNPRSIGLGRH